MIFLHSEELKNFYEAWNNIKTNKTRFGCVNCKGFIDSNA